MRSPGRVWALVLLVLVLSAFVVPFTLLSGVQAWYGSWLYWSAFALVVMGLIVYLTRDWAR